MKEFSQAHSVCSALYKQRFCTEIGNILPTSEMYEAFSNSHSQYPQSLSCIQFNDPRIKFCFPFSEADIKELPGNYQLKSFYQNKVIMKSRSDGSVMMMSRERAVLIFTGYFFFDSA